MMAFLFENDHPNNNFWHSLVNSFQEEKQTDDVEDEMGTHLLKIDCSQERLADTCEYYDALTLPEIQLYEDGELLLLDQLNPEGHNIAGRWQLLDPTSSSFGRKVVWSHPAFARKCVFARNDKEIICVSLAKE